MDQGVYTDGFFLDKCSYFVQKTAKSKVPVWETGCSGAEEADLYFPRAAQRGILSPATTGLEKEHGYTEKMTVDDVRSLTNLR